MTISIIIITRRTAQTEWICFADKLEVASPGRNPSACRSSAGYFDPAARAALFEGAICREVDPTSELRVVRRCLALGCSKRTGRDREGRWVVCLGGLARGGATQVGDPEGRVHHASAGLELDLRVARLGKVSLRDMMDLYGVLSICISASMRVANEESIIPP
ncbi:hypothetical protein C2E23DRAFT_860125 [Lenzites betulinus]|nr:hypothetical protein C2E23DRAFT_860125 [Lenzites betulinus]